MVWQLAAIWIIVITTLLWFIRDERRVRAVRLERQARYFAHAPQYRYVPRTLVPIIPPKRRTGSLLRRDQVFFAEFLSQRAKH